MLVIAQGANGKKMTEKYNTGIFLCQPQGSASFFLFSYGMSLYVCTMILSTQTWLGDSSVLGDEPLPFFCG